tara:strand:+ start:285 stop:2303 length:2019 start_codon:yes stop_codon:yes gene_type:complete
MAETLFTDILTRLRPGYKVGGVVTTPKRGLVDEAGSYGGQKYNLKALGGEGNKYIKTYNTKNGEKRYLADFSREGFNRKSAQPFTEDGLKEARKKVKAFEKKYRDEFGFGTRKGDKAVNPSVTKAKTHPPGKPWKYRMPVVQKDGTRKLVSKYYKSEAKAKAAMEKIRKKKFKGQEVSYKDKLPEIKRLLKAGKTQAEVAKAVKIPFGAVPRALKKIGKKLSDFQPETYLYDEKLKKRLIKDYRKLGRLELAKKLFPNDKLKTADAKFGHLAAKIFEEGRLEPKKSGELSESQRKERGPKKTTTEADAQKRIRRDEKLIKLGSKNYENSLGKFKTEIGRLLGIKEVVGQKSSFMPLDLSHRSDIGLLSRLGKQEILSEDLGLEFTEANRRGVRRYQFGVKTLEAKLKPLYAEQKRLYNRASREGVSKNLSNLIQNNNDKIDNLFKKTNPVIAAKLNPIFINPATAEPFRITSGKARTLMDVGKPLSQVELGGVEDFQIKRNYADQIVKIAKQEGLLKISDRNSKKIINKYFDDANTRAPIKTVNRTVGSETVKVKRGTEGFVPNKRAVLRSLGMLAKGVGKVIKPVGIATGLAAVTTAVNAGERNPFDLAGAYVTSDPQIATDARRMRQEPEFRRQQLAGLPQIQPEGFELFEQEDFTSVPSGGITSVKGVI